MQRTVVIRAVNSAIVEGPDGVRAFIQSCAGRYIQVEAIDQCVVGMKPKSSGVDKAQMVHSPDGRQGVQVQQEVMPLILITLIGTLEVPREALEKAAEERPASGESPH
jgi:hypothetical protein